MNTHKSARTTVHSRALIVKRFEQGWTQQKIAESLGISRRTVCKWLCRWRESKHAGLDNRSTRPQET